MTAAKNRIPIAQGERSRRQQPANSVGMVQRCHKLGGLKSQSTA